MYPCEVKQFDKRYTLSIRFRSPVQDLSQHFGRIYGAVMQYLGEQGEQPAGMPFAAYHNMDMQDMDVEAGFPVARPLTGKGEITAGELPGGIYAVCQYTGPYDGVGAAWEDLMKFMAEKGYKAAGAGYEWYLNDPSQVAPEDLRTDLTMAVVPIEKTQEA